LRDHDLNRLHERREEQAQQKPKKVEEQ